MNRLLWTIYFLTVIILCCAATVCQAQWRIETVDTQGAVGRFTSIAVDSSGNPHISYLDEDNKSLKYATRDFTGWETVTVDSVGTIENTTSITLDHRQIPRISYYEKTDRNLWYASRETGVWIVEQVDSEGWNGSGSDILIDKMGRPHISYLMDHPVIHVKYAVKTSAGWEVEKIGDDEIFGRATSLVLDRNEVPHLCYLFGWNLVLSTKIDGEWEFETMFDGMQRGRSTTLLLDSQDRLHAAHTGISFGATSQELNVLYTVWDDSSWQTEVIERFPFDGDDRVGWEESMVLDSNGVPHIVYYSVEEQSLKRAVWEGSGWSIETIDNAGDVGMFAAAAIDARDKLHISYFDIEDENLKYATNAPVSTPETGITLLLPATIEAGLPFWFDCILVNTGEMLTGTAVFVLLEIGEEIWFWPTWSQFDSQSGTGLDYRVMDIETGITRLELLPSFPWPDGVSLSGFTFTGAMVTGDLSSIIGNLDTVEF